MTHSIWHPLVWCSDTCYCGMLVWIKIEILILLHHTPTGTISFYTHKYVFSSNTIKYYTSFISNIFLEMGLRIEKKSSIEYFALDFAYKTVQNCEGEAEVIWYCLLPAKFHKIVQILKFSEKLWCSAPCWLSICYHFLILILNITEEPDTPTNSWEFSEKCMGLR